MALAAGDTAASDVALDSWSRSLKGSLRRRVTALVRVVSSLRLSTPRVRWMVLGGRMACSGKGTNAGAAVEDDEDGVARGAACC